MSTRAQLTGFVNGCFDSLHAGHVLLLQTAANYCDNLIIGVNTDEYIRRQKGAGRPTQSVNNRLHAVRKTCDRLPCKVSVRVMDEDTPESMLAKIKPDVYVLGSDYRGQALPGEEHCGRILFVDRMQGVSTTEIIAGPKNP